MTLTIDQMAAELAASGVALPLALARVGAQLAEEGRGLGRDNAAARVYTAASGRGTLGDSVRGRSTAGAEDVVVELTAGEAGTPAAAYARVQELGTQGRGIMPRRARFLSIPTDAAIRGGISSVRDVADPRWVPRRAGGWLVFRGPVLLFVLHPGPIQLQPKHYLRDAFDDVVRITSERLPLATLLGLEAP